MSYTITATDSLTGEPIDTTNYFVSIASVRMHNVDTKPYQQIMDIHTFSSNENVKLWLDIMQDDFMEKVPEISI